MTNQEAIKMLTAKVECMQRETSGMDFDCNFHNCYKCDLNYGQGAMGDQMEALGMAISALQAQTEIVRCKNCKYWRQQTNYQGNPLSFGFCENDDIRTYTNDDHYCGYAKRRS